MREALRTAIAEEPDLNVMEPAALDANSFQLTVSSQHDVLFLLHKPDIILFSLGNPGLEDLQALTDLRKRLQNTPILALTRDEVPGQEQAALECGAQAVLTKAASREELVGALRSIKPDPAHPAVARLGSRPENLQDGQAERNNYPDHLQKEIYNVQNQSQ
jgi:DNA-binding NarL/FixJ family response regulator